MFVVGHNDGGFNDSLDNGFTLRVVLGQKLLLVEELLSSELLSSELLVGELLVGELSLVEVSNALSLQEAGSLTAGGGGGGKRLSSGVCSKGLVESTLSHG